jgi:phosphonate transport system substrate-binding protein
VIRDGPQEEIMQLRPLALLAALALAALALVVTACGPAAEADAEDPANWPDELTIGFVPSREADALVETVQPLADFLSEYLSDEAGKTINVDGFVSTDYTALVEALGPAQQADIGAFGPIALVQAADRHDATPILQSVRFGSATYHTQWMTNDPDRFCDDEPQTDDEGLLYCNGTLEADEGPIGEDALANLEAGEVVFFVGPASASGYFYPATQMQRTGMELDDVNVQFSGGHDASVLAVHRGDAAVAVSFDDARTVVMPDTPEIAETVVVFAYSDEIPNDGFAVRGDLPESLKEAITQALLDYADSEEGQEVLDSIYQINDLVEADLDALDAARQVEANFGE